MCNTRVKLRITKSPEGDKAELIGVCEHCNKQHTIALPDMGGVRAIVDMFRLKKEQLIKNDKTKIYIYA